MMGTFSLAGNVEERHVASECKNERYLRSW